MKTMGGTGVKVSSQMVRTISLQLWLLGLTR